MSSEDQTAAELRAEVEQLRETVHDQQEQIEQLEEQVSDDDADGVITPSRRGFLEGSAATAAAGVLGLTSLGSAGAADTSAGKYGAPGESADIYLDEILDESGDQVADLDDSGNFQFQRGLSMPSANIEEVTNTNGSVYYAGNFAGADADARLNNALSAAVDGDVIYLENATYTASRTGSDSIDKRLRLSGLSAEGCIIDTSWELTGVNTVLENVQVDGDDTVQFDCLQGTVEGCIVSGSATVAADRVLFDRINGNGSLTFESGTSDGDVGVVSGLISVTDNGTNP